LALDGYLFDKTGNRLVYYPIEEHFHKAIFSEDKMWNSYIQLRKLQDYYGTAIYKNDELITLANDLQEYLPRIEQRYNSKVSDLIRCLTDKRVVKAIFAGD
jgi:hypothetical protein